MTNTCSVSLSLIKMFINHTRHRKIFFTPSPGASIKKVQFFFETHLKRSRKFYKIFNFAINRTCFSKTNINSVESLSSKYFVCKEIIVNDYKIICVFGNFSKKIFQLPTFCFIFCCWKTTQPIIIHLTNFNVICVSFTWATTQNMKFRLKNFLANLNNI